MSAVVPRVLVAFMSKPEDSVLEGARAACNLFNSQGGVADIYIQQDLCVIPYHGLGAMRNVTVMLARERGYEHLMMLDTDVLIEKPDALLGLWRRNKHVIVPYFGQGHLEKQPHRLCDPQFSKTDKGFSPVRWKSVEQNVTIPGYGVPDSTGLVRLKWSVLACVLFDLNVFARLGERPFVDSVIVNEDEYNGLFFRRNGVEWWQDLSAEVKLLKPPTALWESLSQFGGRKPAFFAEAEDASAGA